MTQLIVWGGWQCRNRSFWGLFCFVLNWGLHFHPPIWSYGGVSSASIKTSIRSWHAWSLKAYARVHRRERERAVREAQEWMKWEAVCIICFFVNRNDQTWATERKTQHDKALQVSIDTDMHSISVAW